MSRRKRLSWKTKESKRRNRKTADPYTMNQDRTHVPVEEYMVGDPSEWAEDPVDDLSHMDGTDRNEIGMPEMLPENRSARSVREARMQIAKMEQHFEKKALQCVRIAEALLPGAGEDVIAAQALDLMPLPDESVMDTSIRLTDLGVLASEEEEEEEEEEKEASKLSSAEMLRIMKAEEGEEEEEDEAKEDGDDEDDEDDEDEAKEAGDDADEDGDDAKEEDGEESDKEASAYLDEDLDAMLADMETDMGGDMGTAELGIDMEPQLDLLDHEALLEESDDALQSLMNQNYGVEATQNSRQANIRKKVNQLGRVKEAGSTATDPLSGLWDSAPDVSNVFS